MPGTTKLLVWAAILAFVLAVITTFIGNIWTVEAEGFSRASTNLALIAIAMHLIGKEQGGPSGSSVG